MIRERCMFSGKIEDLLWLPGHWAATRILLYGLLAPTVINIVFQVVKGALSLCLPGSTYSFFKYFIGGPTRLKPCSSRNLSSSSSLIFLAAPSLSLIKNSSIFPAG